ncbi:MAG: selenocysteine-specific translation elongation factor [Actinomycetota bacterium]
MRIFATAGHVDHGKSTLIRTLTGIDPDRWDEEKRRGLTIDIGFAHMVLPSGERVSFVDVPGHIRFISNMLAGVGGIHGCILTIDAREGWMPQTEEHLRILEFVGLRHGVIALTKIDLCDDDTRDLAILDITDRVAGTFLATAPVVPVSSATGLGLDALVVALDHMAHESNGSIDRNRPRLFIDRVFAAKGSGTVVTGTLTDGSFSVGDTVMISPMKLTARVRSIQSLGESHDTIGPGHRVALNLSGIDHSAITRGDAVVRADEWFSSDKVDARLDVLAHLDHAVSRRGAFTIHIGSDEVPARLRVLGTDHIDPGSSASVRLYLERCIPLLPGDRFVLRESGRSETIGGGEILDVDPVFSATRSRPDRSIERIVHERKVVTANHLRLLTDIDVQPTVGNWILSPEEHERRTAAIGALIEASDSSGFDIAQLDEIDRALVGAFSGVVIDDGRVRRAGVEDPLVQHPAIARLEQQRCAPDACTDISPAELRRLAKIGVVFESQGEWFHRCALDDAQEAARTLLASHPDGFTVSQLREHLGITRKHAVPLASALDARGITRRRGDVRIAGPRL